MAFTYALNTSTIAKQPHTLRERIEITAAAGYDAIEPWVSELDAHLASGGSLSELRKLLASNNLKLAGLIGFFDWAGPDQKLRSKGMEEARRNMNQVAELGGTQLAAPPWGIHDPAHAGGFDLPRTIERYRALCDLGDSMGVTPLCEFWGSSKHLSTLAEAAAIVIGCGHPRAALLADIYHLYRGGSDFGGLTKLQGSAIGLVHVNDYPAPANDDPAALTDAHRVFPGHGVAPIVSMLRTLRDIGYHGALSVELFNAEYYKLPALDAARQGLAAIKSVVARM